MADEVDNKVVTMKFDNAAFQAKIQETLNSLSQLQKSLDLSNSLKGLSNISTGNANAELSHMASAVDSISSKFSAMGVVAITTLANITNKAVDAGIRVAKSLSIDPIAAG